MTPLAVFLSSFISVFALGFQSQNVNQGHYVAAFITSFAIGGGTLVLYKVLPDGTWLDTVAYLIGGATGIVCAMWAHRRTLGRKCNTPGRRPGSNPPPPTERKHMNGIELGTQARDIITGFKGTVTGIANYISGCSQVLLVPKASDDGSHKDSQWFDLQRLEAIDGHRIVLNNSATPGPDKAAPKR